MWACGHLRPQAAELIQGLATEAVSMVISQSTSLWFVSQLPTQDLRVCFRERVEDSIPSVFCEPETSMCVGMYGPTSPHMPNHPSLWSGDAGGAMRMPSVLTQSSGRWHSSRQRQMQASQAHPSPLLLNPQQLLPGEWYPHTLSIF